MHFNAFALAVRHERYRIFIVREHEAPLVDVFADHLVRLPTEEPFSRHGPARNAKVAVPLDHGQRRALHVKRQLSISSLRGAFGLLARGDVSDDGETTGDVVLFVEQR